MSLEPTSIEVFMNFLTIIIGAGLVFAIAFKMSGADLKKAGKNIKETLILFPDDMFVATKALLRTKWIFLLPLGFIALGYLNDIIIVFIKFAMEAPPLYSTGVKYLDTFVLISQFLRGFSSLQQPYIIYNIPLSFYIIPLVILFYSPVKRYFERLTGWGLWSIIWMPILCSFAVSLIADGVVFYIVINKYDTPEFQLIRSLSLVSAVFPIALKSLFEGGMIEGIIGATNTTRPGLKLFLLGSTIHFRKLFILNIALSIIAGTTILKIYYVPSLPIINTMLIEKFLFMLFITAPFLIVIRGDKGLHSLAGSAGLIIRHAGRMLTFFFIAMALHFPFNVILFKTTPYIFPLYPNVGQALTGATATTLSLLLSCIIAIAFYINIKRSLDENAEEIA